MIVERSSSHWWMLIWSLVVLGCPLKVLAQHPQEIEELVSQQRYFEALVKAAELPQRQNSDFMQLAVARSEWALGLIEKADKHFTSLVSSAHLNQDQRDESFLAPVVMALQEGNYDRVSQLVEEAVAKMPISDAALTKARLVQSEALMKSGDAVRAAQVLDAIMPMLPEAQRGDAAMLRGQCAKVAGRLEEAESSFELVPIDHPAVGEAVRQLIEIAFQRRDVAKLKYWIEKGRREFPEVISESWSRYLLAMVAIAERNRIEVVRLLEEGEKKSSPSDAWFILLESAAESFLFEGSQVPL